MLPLRFEPYISRLKGKGGYSTRLPETTSSLLIWVEINIASVTYFPPTEREKGVHSVQLGKEGQERRLRRERMELCRWEGGLKLEGEDVASETDEPKAA